MTEEEILELLKRLSPEKLEELYEIIIELYPGDDT